MQSSFSQGETGCWVFFPSRPVLSQGGQPLVRSYKIASLCRVSCGIKKCRVPRAMWRRGWSPGWQPYRLRTCSFQGKLATLLLLEGAGKRRWETKYLYKPIQAPRGSLSAPRYRLIRSLTLRQQLGKYTVKAIQGETGSLDFSACSFCAVLPEGSV